MLRNKNIAFFIDVDNVDLTTDNYDGILAQLEGMGNILTGKVYGAKERKHKGIYESAQVRGYKVERTMRIKRRGRRDFDSRIFVDVVDAVCKAPAIDAVCIITASCDLVYLYSYLHGKGIKIISSEENEQASAEMVDEIVNLGRPPFAAAPAPKQRASARAVSRPVAVKQYSSKKSAKPVAKSVQESDGTDELLREIERLRSLTEEQQAEKEAQKAAIEEARRKAEAQAREREEAEMKAREKAIEEARKSAYAEAQAKIIAEQETKRKAEEEAKARAKAESEARLRAEEENKKKALAEQEAKKKAEAEAKAREEELANARQKAYEEARAKAYEEARAKAYEEAKKEAERETQARLKAEQEARRQAEQEAQAKVKAEEEAKRQALEEAERIRKEAEARQKAYEEAKAREEELNRKIAELEAKRQVEEQAKNVEGAEELMREIENLKHLTSETNKLVKEMKDDPREQVILQYGVSDTQSPREKTDDAAKQTAVAKSATESVQHIIDDAEQNSPAYGSPRAYYIPQNDGTLIRKIEEIRKNNGDGDTDDLLEEIRKLLDGLD